MNPGRPHSPGESPSVDALDDDTVGVALSGGGIRAALFCAGALEAVLEHASAHKKCLRLSTVSGSALLALEWVWSNATTDDAALREVRARIKEYAYWPRRRSWAVASVLALLGAVTYALWSYRRLSASATALWVEVVLALGAAVLLAAFRTQGIWYRKGLIPVSWRNKQPNIYRNKQPNIYTAKPEHFRRACTRMLTLENVVFNATSLTTGDYASFDGAKLPADGAVREFAEASAAFPGAFLPRPLPGRGGLFADGGIYDNTGVTYFRRIDRCPRHVVVVDAGISSAPPKRLPYALLTVLASRTPKALGIITAVLVAGSVLGVLTHVGWLPQVLFWVFLLAILLTLLAVPLAALEGAWSDVRWLGRGWPTTLRVASDLHVTAFKNEHEAHGGLVTIVRLADALPTARTKTQLWKVPPGEADALILAGYEHTQAKLMSAIPVHSRATADGPTVIRVVGGPTVSRTVLTEPEPQSRFVSTHSQDPISKDLEVEGS